MNSCSTTCPRTGAEKVAASPEILTRAEKLAGLLIDVIEFQDFVRLSREVRLDQDVNLILDLMNHCSEDGIGQDSLRAQQKRLEELPIMREFRHAEQAVHELFNVVDDAISRAAGLAFAENAQTSGCG